ncbi:MAG: hypothetical protein KA072_14390, partial [Thermoanaerobaculaceae bacterium]|nr:hypothetical protein [Thermoanaerobaculaceae bacterium]MDI9622941.1 NADH-quinone oxidoreductase subunit L [Acidobacteriota bacterium]
MLNLLWLVLAFPLAGTCLLLAGARRLGHRATAAIGVGSAGLSLLVTLGALVSYAGMHGEVVTQTLYRWIAAGNFTVDLSLRLDSLSAVMLFFVTVVGFLIHVYSVGYMHDEAATA